EGGIAESKNELEAQITYGEATNGVRVGIYKERSGGLPATEEEVSSWRIIPVIEGLSTNAIAVWFAPREFWKIELVDSLGKPVPTTRIGKAQGKKMQVQRQGFQASGFTSARVDSTFPSLIGRGFDLSELFLVKKPGDYTLN